MDDGPRLLTRRDGRVLTVSFNNHPRHFFDRQMSVELDDLTRALRGDTAIGADPDRLSVRQLRDLVEPEGFEFVGASGNRLQDIVTFRRAGGC
jgi:hypothetical protein